MTVAALPSPQSPASRRQRAVAFAIDAATLAGALVIALLVATAWLLARTEAGLLEVRDADARVAAALVLAVPPAWLAWFAPGVVRGASLGQRRARLRVRGTVAARVNRFAFHPLAVPLWAWLTLAIFVAGAPLASVGAALVAVLTTLFALGSLMLWAASPGSRALHDRLGRTRLVSVARAESPP